MKNSMSSIESAVIVIQRWYRKILDINVYRYYRNLINFRSKGDPAVMLRCINPSEAKYFDAASGIHVKFRLAGEQFPPQIYYKIFTHRPVQDIGSYAPRDYSAPDSKQPLARDVHNRTTAPKKCADQSCWYRRYENNGWRLVSDRILHQIVNAPDKITEQTSVKKIPFPHRRMLRRAEVQQKKKHRQIEWMQKLYKVGVSADHTKVISEVRANRVDEAMDMLDTIVASEGPDALDDWEVDKLIEWSNTLNFEDYLVGWKELATSSSSDLPVQDRFRLRASNYDPFEMTISGPSSAGLV